MSIENVNCGQVYKSIDGKINFVDLIFAYFMDPLYSVAPRLSSDLN